MMAFDMLRLRNTAVAASGHTWWRLYITATIGGGTGTYISEMEFRGSVGGADLTPLCVNDTPTGGTVIYSSQQGGNEGFHAFNSDNSVDTGWWSNGAAPQWIGFHFSGSPVDVKEVAITTDAETRWRPSSFALQYSDDGITWTDKTSFTGVSMTSNATFTFATP